MTYNERPIINTVHCPCIKDFQPIHLCVGCVYFVGSEFGDDYRIIKCSWSVQ